MRTIEERICSECGETAYSAAREKDWACSHCGGTIPKNENGPSTLASQTDRTKIQSRIIISQRDNDENWAWGFIGCIADFKRVLMAKRKLLKAGVIAP